MQAFAMMSEKIVIYLKECSEIHMKKLGLLKNLVEKRRFYITVFAQQTGYLQQAAGALCERDN